ncbi:hypothetical protein NL676_031571 [Syzygium grande]|nr:hypothetical protein NL676_031571 [Syzygium grande]
MMRQWKSDDDDAFSIPTAYFLVLSVAFPGKWNRAAKRDAGKCLLAFSGQSMSSARRAQGSSPRGALVIKFPHPY